MSVFQCLLGVIYVTGAENGKFNFKFTEKTFPSKTMSNFEFEGDKYSSETKKDCTINRTVMIMRLRAMSQF